MTAARRVGGFLCLVHLPWVVAVIATTLIWDVLTWPITRTPLGTVVGRGVVRICRAIAPKVLRDERNYPFLYVIFGTGLLGPALFALALWWQSGQEQLDWLALFAYQVAIMGPYFRFFAYYATLAHQHGHQKNGFFKPPFKAIDLYIKYILSFVYGHVPEQYPMAHVRIHHRFDNSLADPTTTRPNDRRQASGILPQLVDQFSSLSGFGVAVHHFRTGKHREGWIMVRGLAWFYGLTALIAWVDWRFALFYVLLSQATIILLIGVVNHVQHAFVDPADPDNVYKNSITILDGHYNVFNEDYHTAHHLRPQCVWQEMKEHYETHLDDYREARTIIFRDTQVYEILFWILLRRYDLMVEHLVDLSGEMTDEDKYELLLSRLAPSPEEPGTATTSAAPVAA